MICANFTNLLKVESLIDVNEEEIVTFVNDEQSVKASSPIEVTDEGIVISNDYHISIASAYL